MLTLNIVVKTIIFNYKDIFFNIFFLNLVIV